MHLLKLAVTDDQPDFTSPIPFPGLADAAVPGRQPFFADARPADHFAGLNRALAYAQSRIERLSRLVDEDEASYKFPTSRFGRTDDDRPRAA